MGDGVVQALAESVHQAVKLLDAANAVLVIAGAGMGVDSGLFTFRAVDGSFILPDYLEKSAHAFFVEHPQEAWAFHGPKTVLFRESTPHAGFDSLLGICRAKSRYYVVTSNIDGQFEKAGFAEDRIFNSHVSTHFWQCMSPACNEFHDPWSAGEWSPEGLPQCKFCGEMARPNVSFFDELETDTFNGRLVLRQYEGFDAFLAEAKQKRRRLCIIEIGCGVTEHSLRLLPETLGRWACISNEWGLEPLVGSLIRIDAGPSVGPPPGKRHKFVLVPTGARHALQLLASGLENRRSMRVPVSTRARR